MDKLKNNRKILNLFTNKIVVQGKHEYVESGMNQAFMKLKWIQKATNFSFGI